MKKLTYILISFLTFFGILYFVNTDSHAEDAEYHYSISSQQGTLGLKSYYFNYSPRVAIRMILQSEEYHTYQYLLYSSADNGNVSVVGHNYIFDSGETINKTINCHFTYLPDYHIYYSADFVDVFGNMSLITNIPCFTSFESLCNYLTSDEEIDEDGEIVGRVDPETGGQYFPPVRPSTSVYSPSTIPSPYIEFKKESNNLGSSYVPFLYIHDGTYDSVNHGRYGLVLDCNWQSIDNIYVESEGRINKTNYLFYDGYVSSDSFDCGYPVPNFGTFNVAPTTIDFESDSESVAAFNQLLDDFPVSSRVTDIFNELMPQERQKIINGLSSRHSKFNTVVVRARYYLFDSDTNTYSFGPWATLSMDFPPSGSKIDILSGLVTTTGDTNSVTYETVDNDGNVTYSNSSSSNINSSYDDFDFTEISNTFNNLRNFLGSIPQFFAYLFSFLPSWVLWLLSFAFSLTIIVGLIRLIRG